MLNQVILVGRLTQDPQGIELNRKVGTITLAIPRCFKNSEGEYETDFIECELWNMVAETTTEYCKKGDIVGVKGRLESRDNKLVVVAEKITFLSSRKEGE